VQESTVSEKKLQESTASGRGRAHAEILASCYAVCATRRVVWSPKLRGADEYLFPMVNRYWSWLAVTRTITHHPTLFDSLRSIGWKY
jgi:hypothetical protein